MAVTDQEIDAFADAILELYGRILLVDIPEDPGYRGFLDRETPFALDYFGYRDSYIGLLRQVFDLPDVRRKWSEDGIQELGHSLMLELAERKHSGEAPPDFRAIARDWLSKIDIPFEKYVCYAPISGLFVHEPLEIGEVTFLPNQGDRPELQDPLAKTLLKELHPIRDCLSRSTVTAEWRRAAQLHRERTERSLNVLRFFAALIWHDQPTRHAYVASELPSRVSGTLVVAPNGAVSLAATSDFTPLPLQVDAETIEYARFYGLDQVRRMLSDREPSDLQQSFLTAIQWFGLATQELLPLIAFVKYYISIEAALKKPSEAAKQVLPRRIGVIIEPWDRTRHATLEPDLSDLIDERNSVFHSGVPLRSAPEVLQWDARILSRQILHQLRLRLKSHKWQTKDDLIAWVDAQYSKYLA